MPALHVVPDPGAANGFGERGADVFGHRVQRLRDHLSRYPRIGYVHPVELEAGRAGGRVATVAHAVHDRRDGHCRRVDVELSPGKQAAIGATGGFGQVESAQHPHQSTKRHACRFDG